jgi:hypothetical protein
MKRALLFVGFALVGGCASLTGLGDDFNFSDDASVEGGVANEGGVDANGGDAGDKVDSSLCGEGFGANQTTEQCRTCLAAHCCPQLTVCAKDTTCTNDVRCIFNCQSNPSTRRDCLNNCDRQTDVAYQATAACISNNCAQNSGPCANLVR